MQIAILVVSILAFVTAAAWLVGIYNGLVQLRNNADKAWNNIDVLLMQRFDELPKLIDTCRAFMKHERDVLESLTEMRTRYRASHDIAEKTGVENQLQQTMTRLRQVWEGYPDLKTSPNFLQIQGRISILEESIADRREFFNESVNLFNIRIESFPDVLAARLLGYQRKAFLDVPEERKADVKMDFGSPV